MEVLPNRFSRYGLTIHPTKSHMVAFGRPPQDTDQRQSSRGGKGTFDFVGFTHYWGRTRSGGWAIKRRTAKKRIRRTCRALWQWCRQNRHQPVPEQHRTLAAKLRGHFQYYGVRCNIQQLLAVKESAEEPYDGIQHVRICGGRGRVTGRLYPDECSGRAPALDEDCFASHNRTTLLFEDGRNDGCTVGRSLADYRWPVA
jgi:hypothetical protein